MLALEYMLIDIPLISCIPKHRDQLYEYNRALEYTISFLSLIINSPEVSGRAEVTRNISTTCPD